MTTRSILKDMSRTVEALKKEPARRLSVTDIKKEGVMPWALHHQTIIGIIKADMHGPNILKAEVDKKEKTTRYSVKAENLIKYITLYGPVLASTVRKQHK